MKKIVIKTALFTLAIVLGLSALIYGGLVLFAPSALAKLYDNLGNYGLSTHFYQKQYEKTQSDQDLYTLCLELNEYEDSARTQKFLGELIDEDSKAFNDFCQAKDKEFPSSLSTKEYCIGKYVCAVYVNEGCDKLVDKVGKLIQNNYTDKNGFYLLINDARISLSKAELSLISTKISVMLPSLSIESASYALRDINLITQKITKS